MSQPPLLQVPKQHDFTNPAVELDPDRVAAWLNQLPPLNPGRSARAILDALQPANLQPMPAKIRIRLLELYRATFITMFAGLDEQALRAQALTGEQRALAMSCGAAVVRELGNGYKLVVRELYADQPDRRPLLTVALFRAMEAVALTLLDDYRHYRTPAPFTWLELHQLHLLAERLGVDDQPVRHDRDLLDEHGVGALYRRALMLSTADPHRLPAGAAATLYDLLGELTSHAQLRPWTGEAADGCFVVDRSGDSPPIPGKWTSSAYGYDHALLLDLRPAAQRADDRLRQLRARRSEDDERMRLLALLAPPFHPPRQRQAPRRQTRRGAWLSFGLTSVHHCLTRNERALAQAMSEPQDGARQRDLAGDAGQTPVLEAWQIVNESASGYLLSSRSRWRGESLIGELLALLTASQDPQAPRLSVAVVRWMRAGRNRAVEMGVELIPGNVRAVQCEADDIIHPALLFADVPALRLPANIVTVGGVHRADARMQLRTGNRVRAVRAGALLKETPCFQQFGFENLD